MLHAYDLETHLNFVQTYPTSNESNWLAYFKGLATFTHSIGREIRILSSDNATQIGLKFRSYLRDKSIAWEPSAPHTQAQDSAERAGGLIITMARAMRLHSRLPHDLWPEIVCAAAYILNRSPVAMKGWKTPYELGTERQPTVAHLRTYGSRAYVHLKGSRAPLKRQKLEARAHIGYLVGWDSTSIFRIWIPSRNEVIRTRDVVFDEQTFYHPGEVDLGHAVDEMVPTLTPAAPAQYYELEEDIHLQSNAGNRQRVPNDQLLLTQAPHWPEHQPHWLQASITDLYYQQQFPVPATLPSYNQLYVQQAKEFAEQPIRDQMNSEADGSEHQPEGTHTVLPHQNSVQSICQNPAHLVKEALEVPLETQTSTSPNNDLPGYVISMPNKRQRVFYSHKALPQASITFHSMLATAYLSSLFLSDLPTLENSESSGINLGLRTHGLAASTITNRSLATTSSSSSTTMVSTRSRGACTGPSSTPLVVAAPAVDTEPEQHLQRSIQQPHHHQSHRDDLPSEPKYWHNVQKHPHREHWIKAANIEFSKGLSTGTYE